MYDLIQTGQEQARHTLSSSPGAFRSSMRMLVRQLTECGWSGTIQVRFRFRVHYPEDIHASPTKRSIPFFITLRTLESTPGQRIGKPLNNRIQSRLITTLCRGLLVLAAPFACAADPAAAAVPRWELTLGVHPSQSADGSKISLPKAEVEYQWRERIKLTSALSWPAIHPVGESSSSGVGIGEIGLKLLFWDAPDARFSMALCPQMARFVNASSVRRGIVSAQREFALPIETKFTAAGVEFELRAGRTFIESGPDEWTVELKAARPCLPRIDCAVTIARNFVPLGPPRVSIMPGVDWKLNDSVSLKTLIGREFGPRTVDRQDLAIGVELKIVY